MRRRGGRSIWALMRGSDLLAVALTLWVGALPAAAEAPARVVSMNLCTDQLAMLLAAPGQLQSVSHLARDPMSSTMVDEARAYPENRGGAEQIFLMHPDLVLAGSYTSLASVTLLRGLGVRVEQLEPARCGDLSRRTRRRTLDRLGPDPSLLLVCRACNPLRGLSAAILRDVFALLGLCLLRHRVRGGRVVGAHDEVVALRQNGRVLANIGNDERCARRQALGDFLSHVLGHGDAV